MQVVGQSVMRKDALAKVLGQAKFASDLSLPGMLHLKLVPAERPHARITGIDIAAAKRQPGVVAVFTAADVPVNRFGLLVADQPVLADEVVRFVGDKVAAVVAETLAQAVRAAGMIQVTSQDLPVLAEPMAAMQPGMPLIHPGHPGNIAHTVRLRRGNIE
ncbi:MAG TPA: aldehyde oxidase, partial [Anaerolineae bacterium]|nr:aldehyde oxidase [Anaerolineae bacterium]